MKCHHCKETFHEEEPHECTDAPDEAMCAECGDWCSAAETLCTRCLNAGQENYQESVQDSYMMAIRGY